MLQHLKRRCRPTTYLLMIGFAISLTSVLIGISSMNSIMLSLEETDTQTPIFLTMHNTGLSLALAIYVFSIANCLIVTNYWIITQRRNMAIYKAFGWSNLQLIGSVVADMAGILLVSLILSILLLCVLSCWNMAMFAVEMTPFFIVGTIALLLFTLTLATVIPIIKILRIHPAEVIS